ncbi:hypothetical protein CPB84DRAFT_567998 [Gymnopilus junonius]|uniref:Uncharacterized protein n=1 Tax=Gymnopilus junonius TaxID=109634 RepID=A0A9P5TR11_GYMJU|nr:hypothetical protein CPB84DRAFT_567998 [Gymnopilus junonius]
MRTCLQAIDMCNRLLENLVGYRQWEDILAWMKPIRKIVHTICALISLVIRLFVAFLQIGGFTERTCAQTSVILCSIFSAAGLAMSRMYIVMGSKL